MDTQSSRQALAHLWSIVAAARERSPSAFDRKELGRLCDLLQDKLPADETLATAVESLCLRLESSISEPDCDVLEPETTLEEIDRVLLMLE